MPRQQLVDPACGMIGDAGEHIGEARAIERAGAVVEQVGREGGQARPRPAVPVPPVSFMHFSFAECLRGRGRGLLL